MSSVSSDVHDIVHELFSDFSPVHVQVDPHNEGSPCNGPYFVFASMSHTVELSLVFRPYQSK